MKKVCVVTGSRAEYGLLRWLMQGIAESPKLQLQLIATGSHLSPEFGLTANSIEADGFVIDARVEMLLSSDTPSGVTKSMGLGLIGFADAISQLKPDLMLLLGDRYEIFSAAAAAMVARLPIAHLHGGESTEGAIDEAIRHSITKMSHLHFVAAEPYRQRVIQLGEDHKHVFNVGGLGIDSILKCALLSKEALESELDFRFQKTNLLVTFHPATLESNSSGSQMQELLAALSELRDTGLIFTMPNADADGRVIIDQIEKFCAKHENARAYTSLGQQRYLSCLKQVSAVVGNSSSGLTEAPSFGKPTVNIGDRQLGRLRAASVIDCQPNRASIQEALERALSGQFQAQAETAVNPYGCGGASQAIVKILESQPLTGLLKKKFGDRHQLASHE